MILAQHLFENLTKEKKLECLDEIIRLKQQIDNGIGLGETYYILLDNDVLNALDKPNSRSTKYIALIVLFIVLKKINIAIKLLINPVIFYEFNSEKAFSAEEEFDYAMDRLVKLLFKLGLEVFISDMETFKEAKKNFKSIKHDIKKINNALIKIKSTNFSLNLDNNIDNSNYLFTPIIACRVSPKINTKYFSSNLVQKFIDCEVQNKIMHEKENSKNVKMIRHKATLDLSRLVKIKKGKLKGIGDLSLLSFCNMNEQFYSTSNKVTIAISFDETLEKNLKNQSQIVACERFDFSEDKDKIYKQFNNMINIQKKFDYIDKKVDNFSSNFKYELLKIEWIKSFSYYFEKEFNFRKR